MMPVIKHDRGEKKGDNLCLSSFPSKSKFPMVVSVEPNSLVCLSIRGDWENKLFFILLWELVPTLLETIK